VSEQPQGARRYDNRRRAQSAALTRRRVIDAAATLFGAQGYVATSIRQIAQTAGVSAETVYAVFGSKSELLRAWLETALVGDDDPVAWADRPYWAELAALPTLEERVAAASRIGRIGQERTAIPMSVIAEAAGVDPDMAELVTRIEAMRRQDFERLIDVVSGDAHPLGEPDRTQVIDLFLVLSSAEVYRRLVGEMGWTGELYERELARLYLAAGVRTSPVTRADDEAASARPGRPMG
jgi:AcrR family transcriptional regulator